MEDSMIQPGQRVRIPAGIEVRSTGKPSVRTTKRSQVVKVDHLLPAYRQILAHTTKYADGTEETRFDGTWRERIALCQRFDLPCRTDREMEESLKTLLPRTTPENRYPHGKVILHWLEIAPEKVRWAGSGGYWCEAALSAAEPV